MPQFSTKHTKREHTLSFDSFHGGYNEERGATNLSKDELSECKNLKYVKKPNDQGREVVSLKKRHGTVRISNTAHSNSYGVGRIYACTYYKEKSQYIICGIDDGWFKLYYLDTNGDPVEIGNVWTAPTFTEFNGKLIIHDGDATKAWDGANYYILPRSFYDELLATGDNAETEFTGTLTHTPVSELGHIGASVALSITFTDGTAKTITDDGAGQLIGSVGTTWIKTITDIVDSPTTPGIFRVTANAHAFSDGDEINIQGVVGTGGLTAAVNNTLTNPTWTVMNDETNTFDLTGSTFAGVYTSGGLASKNTINYATGVYNFKCSGAPDSATLVEIDYEENNNGEESGGGLIRKSRLYMWGCPEHWSRLYYTAVNDEVGVDSSAGGGYVDIDPGDGDKLIGAINFETSLLLFKENSLHRMDDYPGDATFKVEKLTDDLGCVSGRTIHFEGGIVSFLSEEGWVAMHPSQRYGDIQKGVPLSKAFNTNARKYANETASVIYNSIDRELWLILGESNG
jgi:hypothetical protein